MNAGQVATNLTRDEVFSGRASWAKENLVFSLVKDKNSNLL